MAAAQQKTVQTETMQNPSAYERTAPEKETNELPKEKKKGGGKVDGSLQYMLKKEAFLAHPYLRACLAEHKALKLLVMKVGQASEAWVEKTASVDFDQEVTPDWTPLGENVGKVP